ncbi:hypothetical protein COLO4_15153 [Corchorus olitorius]|uniref:Uncharacterized protein n=1 Tax=Corchorus olitorius TaxID=93759 RepID=A0A1R3JPB1_9ROSI|nr:hypothetical protein COLO4_15153 [Corchorus olitorius]
MEGKTEWENRDKEEGFLSVEGKEASWQNLSIEQPTLWKRGRKKKLSSQKTYRSSLSLSNSPGKYTKKLQKALSIGVNVKRRRNEAMAAGGGVHRSEEGGVGGAGTMGVKG